MSAIFWIILRVVLLLVGALVVSRQDAVATIGISEHITAALTLGAALAVWLKIFPARSAEAGYWRPMGPFLPMAKYPLAFWAFAGLAMLIGGIFALGVTVATGEQYNPLSVMIVSLSVATLTAVKIASQKRKT